MTHQHTVTNDDATTWSLTNRWERDIIQHRARLIY